MVSSEGGAPKVSIAIVNWNTRDLLEACLGSIFKETTAFPVEVIVVDNNSNDGSCEMVKKIFKQVTLIENPENLGFARGTNQGLQSARGEYALMLNSDTVILDGAIEKTVAFADSHPEAAGIGCKLVYPDGRFQNSCFRLPNLFGTVMESVFLAHSFKRSYILNWNRYGCRDHDWKTYREVDCVMGSFVLLRRSILEDVGLLDNDYFMYGEETDLCYRIKKAGWKIYYYPDATIVHVHGGSQKTWADVAWAYNANIQGILLFLYKWKRLTAYSCNLVMTLLMVPRLLIWAALDLKEFIKSGSFEKKHIMKGSNFPIHLKTIFRPATMAGKWGRR